MYAVKSMAMIILFNGHDLAMKICLYENSWGHDYRPDMDWRHSWGFHGDIYVIMRFSWGHICDHGIFMAIK
jgi:hypothetical protein